MDSFGYRFALPRPQKLRSCARCELMVEMCVSRIVMMYVFMAVSFCNREGIFLRYLVISCAVLHKLCAPQGVFVAVTEASAASLQVSAFHVTMDCHMQLDNDIACGNGVIPHAPALMRVLVQRC